MPLGKTIKKLRKERNWTQDEFAEKVGVHGRHISRWERDINRPSSKILGRIAEVFRIPVDELTQEADVPLETLLPDSDLFRQFQAMSKLGDEEKKPSSSSSRPLLPSTK